MDVKFIQLSPQEKLKLADRLRSQASVGQWRTLSKKLPDVPEVTMDEIVNEVKAVRRLRNQG
jgi:hypothetical protein